MDKFINWSINLFIYNYSWYVEKLSNNRNLIVCLCYYLSNNWCSSHDCCDWNWTRFTLWWNRKNQLNGNDFYVINSWFNWLMWYEYEWVEIFLCVVAFVVLINRNALWFFNSVHSNLVFQKYPFFRQIVFESLHLFFNFICT